MKLISISGKAGSGKDTVRAIIEAELFKQTGVRLTPISFAGPLKEALCLWFGWDLHRLTHDFPYKEGGLGNTDPSDIDPYCVALGMTRRVIMQKFGTECLRQGMHRDFWIILQEIGIKLGRIPGEVFIVSDARFMNELEFAKRNDGYMIHVRSVSVREGQTTDEALGDERVSTLTTHTGHASENEFEQWDAYTNRIINYKFEALHEEDSKRIFREFVVNTVVPDIKGRMGL